MATHVLIQTVTVGSGGAASIEFTSIPQTYTDLLIKASTRSLNSAVYHFALITFNGNTSGYSGRRLEGGGTSASSYTGSATSVAVNFGVGANATASVFGNAEVYIPNYTASSNKSVSTDVVGENNATTAYQILNADLWSNSAAITSITITGDSGNFVQYSSVSLYGISNT